MRIGLEETAIERARRTLIEWVLRKWRRAGVTAQNCFAEGIAAGEPGDQTGGRQLLEKISSVNVIVHKPIFQ